MARRRSTKTTKTRHSKAQSLRLSYLPGLDGLRALAILGVLLYHAEATWLPGGFLGVETFFVISGYLITSLLLAEWQQTGHIDLKAFWLRRARRLLPALFLVIVASLAFAVLFLPGEVAGLRGDALAATGYVTNWYLIFSHQSYFEAVGRPSLLRHLWSLAVEEQFYLLWPLLFTAGIMFLKRRRMLLTVLAGAVASSVLMASLYRPDVDPSRVYYGTDTRAAGLLIGAALALVWIPARLGRPSDKVRAWLLDGVGLGALAMLIVLYAWLDEFQPFLYQGGIAVVALTTALLIAVAVHPRARLISGLLGQRGLRWIGLRSYSIYLWHWPIFMITRPQLDVPLEGLPLLALRLAATGIVAELSYRYIETPIRNGALGRAWRALHKAEDIPRWQLGLRWAGVMGAMIALSAALGVPVVSAQPPAPPSYLSVESIQTWPTVATPVAESAMVDLIPSPTPAAKQEAATWSLTPTIQSPTPVPEPATRTDEADLPKPRLSAMSRLDPAGSQPASTRKLASLSVTAIGDSVLLGTASQLQRAIPGIGIDAAVNRQASAAIEILKAQRAAGQLGSVVIIHLGNNGTFSAKQFDEIMQILGEDRRVIFVNVKVPRVWESPNNTVLTNGVKQYPNARLVDWRGASLHHPEYFWEDGIHLRPEGAQVYANLIATYIQVQSSPLQAQ